MAQSVWQNQRVTILGLSKSGIAAARYLAQQGANCFLSETLPATPQNSEAKHALEALGVDVEMGGHSQKAFEHADLVVISPGIPPTSPILQQLSLSGKTIWSEVELAYREAKAPFIGITGTNGKTTTTTLTARILQAAGKQAPACGNIGTPIISLVESQPDVYVAELSSFQLTFSPTLRAQVAIYMNFRPDHLDWHGSVEAYKKAKAVLFQNQQATDWAVLNADDPVCRDLAKQISSQVLWFSRHLPAVAQEPNWISLDEQNMIVIQTADQGRHSLFDISRIQLVGKHNQENVLASVAATWLQGVSVDVIEQAVNAFEGVEHRLEPVATVDGVTYYNDSKATNPDATLSALAAFEPRQIVLIAGGRDKKTDLAEFVDSVKDHAEHVVLLGEAAERFGTALKTAGYSAVSFADSLEHAIELASRFASPDVPVLFSPACASFDMFPNFEARGRAFKEAVRQRRAIATG